ncbi:hypothetical protein AVEN_235181-1 [Araneus ventricosus]|uniref:Uncharacterized protein n=1 Tax=Araneus ventricosus TaxID=182803 RepID=A0A4Y2WQU3_ARAVE|nr:hypothetical protein AVEN_130152-1 [Araneus ventricosus]GBO39106.1 hypothetical protein AVEN_235181-1 [Araneus ventricosus]
MSSTRNLDESSTSVASSFSRMLLPSDCARVKRILSSSSWRDFLLAAVCTISCCRASSRSGLERDDARYACVLDDTVTTTNLECKYAKRRPIRLKVSDWFKIVVFDEIIKKLFMT